MEKFHKHYGFSSIPNLYEIQVPTLTFETKDSTETLNKRVLGTFRAFVDSEKLKSFIKAFFEKYHGSKPKPSELWPALNEMIEPLSTKPSFGVFSKATSIFGIVEDEGSILIVQLDHILGSTPLKVGENYFFLGEVKTLESLPFLNVELLVPAAGLNHDLYHAFLSRIYPAIPQVSANSN